MKIQGPNSYIKAYKNVTQQKPIKKEQMNQKDQLNISTEAKKMHEMKHIEQKRAEYVKGIKQSVQSGDYEVDHERLAQKMIDFWSKGN